MNDQINSLRFTTIQSNLKNENKLNFETFRFFNTVTTQMDVSSDFDDIFYDFRLSIRKYFDQSAKMLICDLLKVDNVGRQQIMNDITGDDLFICLNNRGFVGSIENIQKFRDLLLIAAQKPNNHYFQLKDLYQWVEQWILNNNNKQEEPKKKKQKLDSKEVPKLVFNISNNANTNNNNNSSVAAPISIESDPRKLANYLTPEIRKYLSLVMFPKDSVSQVKFMKMEAPDAVRLMNQEMYFGDKKKRDQLIEWLEQITSAKLFVQYLRTGMDEKQMEQMVKLETHLCISTSLDPLPADAKQLLFLGKSFEDLVEKCKRWTISEIESPLPTEIEILLPDLFKSNNIPLETPVQSNVSCCEILVWLEVRISVVPSGKEIGELLDKLQENSMSTILMISEHFEVNGMDKTQIEGNFQKLSHVLTEVGYLKDTNVVKFIRELRKSETSEIIEFHDQLTTVRVANIVESKFHSEQKEILCDILKVQNDKLCDILKDYLNSKENLHTFLKKLKDSNVKDKDILYPLESIIVSMLSIYYDEQAYVWITSIHATNLVASTQFLGFLSHLIGSSKNLPTDLFVLCEEKSFQKHLLAPMNWNWNGCLSFDFAVTTKISLDLPPMPPSQQLFFRPNEIFHELISDCRNWVESASFELPPNLENRVSDFYWCIKNFLKQKEAPKLVFKVTNSDNNTNTNNNINSSNSVASSTSIEYNPLILANYLIPEIRDRLSLVMFPKDYVFQDKFMKMEAPSAFRLMNREMYFDDKKKRDQLIEWLEQITSAKLFVEYLRTGEQLTNLRMRSKIEIRYSKSGKQEQ